MRTTLSAQRRYGIAVSYLYQLANMAIGVFISAYIVRTLGDTTHGVYQSMTAFASYLALVNFGVSTIMTRNIALALGHGDRDAAQRAISTVLRITAMITAGMAVLAVVLYLNINGLYQKTMTVEMIERGKMLFLIVSVNLLLSIWVQAFEGIAYGHEEFVVPKSAALARLLLRTGLVLVLLPLKNDPIVLVLIDLSLTIIMLVFIIGYDKATYKIQITSREYDRSLFRVTLSFAAALMLQSIVNQLNTTIPKFVISITINPESVSIFSIAMVVYQMFSSVSTAPISVFLPKITRGVASGWTSTEMTDQLIAPSRLITLLGGAIMFGFIAMGRPFLVLLYGEAYLPAWACAIVIMGAMYLNMITGLSVNILDALGKRLVRSVILLLSTVLGFLLSLYCTRQMGIVGASIAASAAILLGQVVVMNIYYVKVIRLQVMRLYGEAMKGIVPSLLIGCATSCLVTRYTATSWIVLLGNGALFICVTAACLFAFGLTPDEKTRFTNSIKRRMMRGE